MERALKKARAWGFRGDGGAVGSPLWGWALQAKIPRATLVPRFALGWLGTGLWPLKLGRRLGGAEVCGNLCIAPFGTIPGNYVAKHQGAP